MCTYVKMRWPFKKEKISKYAKGLIKNDWLWVEDFFSLNYTVIFKFFKF